MLDDLYRAIVREIMIPIHDTPFMEKSATWAEFLTKLAARAHAWVVDNSDDMKVVGVVTEHDMLRSMIPPGDRKATMFGSPKAEIFCIKQSVVEDIMTHNPVVCSPEETVGDALKKFSSFDIRRLAVVDEDRRLLGELTIQVLVKQLRYRFLDTL
ncbi:MAG: CBS domain-containing protein [Dehalococcoidia bacterium]